MTGPSPSRTSVPACRKISVRTAASCAPRHLYKSVKTGFLSLLFFYDDVRPPCAITAASSLCQTCIFTEHSREWDRVSTWCKCLAGSMWVCQYWVWTAYLISNCEPSLFNIQRRPWSQLPGEIQTGKHPKKSIACKLIRMKREMAFPRTWPPIYLTAC